MAIFAKLSFSLRASTPFAFLGLGICGGAFSSEPARVEMVLNLSRQDIGQLTDFVPRGRTLSRRRRVGVPA
jgi:hypothetical protein